MGAIRINVTFRHPPPREGEPFELRFDHDFTAPVTAVVGPSGCGKTTLLQLLAGLLRPASGAIDCSGVCWFDGAAGRYLPARRRGIGYVFQEGRLFEHMSVRANLRYGARRAGPEAIAFDELVDLLGMADWMDRSPADLSGGQRQRVALGRALLSRPRLLLMDEPLASLDRPTVWRLLGELHPLLRRIEVPAIYVTHHLSEAMFLAGEDGELVVMEAGQKQAAGPPSAVLARPGIGHMEREEPLENVWTLPIDWTAGRPRARLDAQRLLDLPPDVPEGSGEAMVALRANDVILATERPAGLSARNVAPGTIEQITRADGDCWVRVDIGVPLLVHVTASAVDELALAEGGTVFAVIKSTSLQVMRA